MDKSKDFRAVSRTGRAGMGTLSLGLGMVKQSRVTGHNMTEMGLDQCTVLFALWHDS